MPTHWRSVRGTQHINVMFFAFAAKINENDENDEDDEDDED